MSVPATVLAAFRAAVSHGQDPVRAVGVAMFGHDYPLFEGDPEWSGHRPTWSRTHWAKQLAAECSALTPTTIQHEAA